MKTTLVFTALILAINILNALPTERNDTETTQQQSLPLPIKDKEVKPEPEKKPEEEETAEEENQEVEPEEEEATLNENSEEDEEENMEPKTEEEIDEEEEAELNPNLFEGDLKLSKEEIENLQENTISKKDAVAANTRKWPGARVPYILDGRFAKDRKRMRVLRAAIRQFSRLTCVRFVPKRRRDRNYVKFIIDKGCYSTEIGKKRRGGEQRISIGNGCNYPGTVIHEMMHAIGFFHEHTRLDRDQYVNIIWSNIERKRESQFMKYGHGEGDYLNEPYDYDSVMHYPRTGFGIVVNGRRQATIIPKDKPWRKIGQRKGFSAIDLRQINKLYKCTKFTSKY